MGEGSMAKRSLAKIIQEEKDLAPPPDPALNKVDDDEPEET